MFPNFKDSGRYTASHSSPNGPGDARPTAAQIIQDNDLVGKLNDKAVFLTGGSNGLGVDEVRTLAMTGAQVFFTSRDMSKGEKVMANVLEEAEKEWSVKPWIEVLKMDLQSLDSVRECVGEFETRSEKLNILVNNAGIALTPHGFTKDGYEQQFGVNHLAHFYLFQLLKPMLLASSTPPFHSRVISVSSAVHQMGSAKVGDYNLEECGYDPFMAYASSKTCNIWMANEVERRYGATGLHGISVHPGGIETGLQASHADEPGRLISEMIKQEHIAKSFKSVEQGAASVVVAAVGKEYEGVGGFYMEDCGVSPRFPKDAPVGTPGYMLWAYDEEGEKRLWADSLQMLSLQDHQ